MQDKIFQYKKIALAFVTLISACNASIEPEINYSQNSLSIKIPKGYYLDNYAINDEHGNVTGKLRDNICHSNEVCSKISSVEIIITPSSGKLTLSEIISPANLDGYWEKMGSKNIKSIQAGQCYTLSGMLYELDIGEKKRMDGMFSTKFCLNQMGQLKNQQ